ncbi:MAG: UTRA domain-containing protein [Lachnospiraceae bacterium]|nr:UTRA domain-containing protein [Lachnospiraceae bacterium]
MVCIYNPSDALSLFSNEIETFREACYRNGLSYETRVVKFQECLSDEAISRRTGFAAGEELYYIMRIHIIDGEPLILNHNYFLKSVAKGLTAEIAAHSVYDHLENTLGVVIVSAKRTITVQKVTPDDKKYLNIPAHDYNCLAVMTNHTYESNGILFEHTESRHLPSHFLFSSTATRISSRTR